MDSVYCRMVWRLIMFLETLIASKGCKEGKMRVHFVELAVRSCKRLNEKKSNDPPGPTELLQIND